jgi:retron-type reverse transcriptase
MISEDQTLFSQRELEQAIRRANMRSAKGHDNISNRMVKLACEVEAFSKLLLSAINNQVYKKVKYPTEFKTARTIPLPKQKQGDYRPISLLPSLSKIIEYMIQIRMRNIIESKIPRHQFGCRPGHSTAQALMRLMHYAGTTAGNEEQFGAISYDFSKAYDRVPKHILLEKMIKLKVPAY